MGRHGIGWLRWVVAATALALVGTATVGTAPMTTPGSPGPLEQVIAHRLRAVG